MKVLLVAHGYPPELVGGTEASVQALARGLAARGHAVVVVAGSMQHEQGFRRSRAVDRGEDGSLLIPVHRIHRADLFFDHWQKSASARVASAFRDVLREERPDVVHVHHWIRLTRDLVSLAAREGIPAAVTLHDLWTTCLIAFRVRPDTKEFCEAPLGMDPCLACAGSLPPRTPWVPREQQALLLAERRAALVRELELARAVIVPSRAHATATARFLGVALEGLSLRVVPHGRDLALAPQPPPPPPGPDVPLRLGAWGHLHPLKGADLLLEALRRLPDPSRVELSLAGGEVEPGFRARLEELARGLAVRFHGPFAAEELDRHPVAAVHAMVSGTRAHESWGLVVEEAAALRLPMVLPRAGAFPERLVEGQGVLFYEPGDAASLADVLARLLEPGRLAALRAALPAAERLVPSVERHVARVLEVYDEVARAGAPAAPESGWWDEKLALAAEEAWDASLSARTPGELGFPEAEAGTP